MPVVKQWLRGRSDGACQGVGANRLSDDSGSIRGEDMRHLLLLFITCGSVVSVLPGFSAAAAEQVTAPQVTAAAVDLDAVLLDLNSPDFTTRQSAQARLRELTADQISLLGRHAETASAAETAISCVRALEYHLLQPDANRARTAWEALEMLLSSDRHLVREDAHWVLSSQWKIRGQLAVDELRKDGAAIVLPEAAAAAKAVHDRRAMERQAPAAGRLPRGIFNGWRVPSPTVQVFLSDRWKGDLSDLRMLQRMPGLQLRDAQAFAGNVRVQRRLPFGARNRNAPTPVQIFLIDGHTLDAEATEWIRGAFGQRVQERGAVMLGITSDGATVGRGCVIGTVVPFGSGDAAGLSSGDLVVSLAGREITRFADLVDELRSFSAGETVDVTLRRVAVENGQPSAQTLVIPVLLRTWQDYADAVNSAAAEFDAARERSATPTGVR